MKIRAFVGEIVSTYRTPRRKKYANSKYALSVILLGLGLHSAMAGSVLQPGLTVGLPLGMPFKEGVYFIDTSSFGNRHDTSGTVNINVPAIIWATPFSFYNTRLQLVALQPVVATLDHKPNDVSYFNSTLFAAQLAHDFGNGIGVSYLAGYRTAMSDALAYRTASFEQRGAVSYVANGWDVTVDVSNGIFGSNKSYPDWLNVDLTLTKKIDKFEFGPVAFGSEDISSPFPGYKRQGQFAVGGLVGYNFGPFTLQAFGTTDVAERGYPGKETRGWIRLIVPLYQAQSTAPANSVVAKY
jgi:hypothetical protein